MRKEAIVVRSSILSQEVEDLTAKVVERAKVGRALILLLHHLQSMIHLPYMSTLLSIRRILHMSIR
jgi:hypothetical protein